MNWLTNFSVRYSNGLTNHMPFYHLNSGILIIPYSGMWAFGKNLSIENLKVLSPLGFKVRIRWLKKHWKFDIFRKGLMIDQGTLLLLKCCSELFASIGSGRLKWHIMVIQSPKYTLLKRLQTSSHLCKRLPNPYIYYCHSHLLSVANHIYNIL